MRRASLMGLALLGALGAGPFVATTGACVSDNFPTYLRDRGTGIATSLLGTYVRKGELLAYPFSEHTGNNEQEYKLSELGFAGEDGYGGKYTEQAGVMFLSCAISPKWRAVLAMEGEQDEAAIIGEAQWRIAPRAVLKLNNGFGLTSKAPDLAPEVGLALSL